MKKRILMAEVLLTVTVHQVYAEPIPSGSNVEIYGLLDAGVSFISNEGGHKNLKSDDGIYFPNLIGFKGSEDIGGGLHTIFNLVDQFSLGTGAIIKGQNKLFGRDSYVGLASTQYGRLTLGNQLDFMFDSLFLGHNDAAMYVGGLYNFRNGPFGKIALPGDPPYAGSFDWDRMSGETVSNSVKYVSPTFNGFSFGTLYGFGGIAGSFGNNSTVSAGANYEMNTFGAGVAYTKVNYGGNVPRDTNVTNWGAGAHYGFGDWVTSVLLTTVRNSANGGVIGEVELGATYHFNSFWALGADYMYMKGNKYLNDNHAHQVTAKLNYAFSRRTGMYLETVYQRTNAGAQALVNGLLNPTDTSSGPNQFIMRIGLQTRF